jgi:hypothetical protein
LIPAARKEIAAPLAQIENESNDSTPDAPNAA